MTRNTSAIMRSSTALLLLLVIISLAASTGRVNAVPPQQTAADGEQLFNSSCAACHSIGGGDLVGPDLEGVTTRPGRDNDWLTRWLLEPDVMLADGDAIATELLAQYNNVPMPNLALSETDVASLIAFLETKGDASQPPTTDSVANVGEGDYQEGKNLFTGATRLSNGGPSCRACHSSGGIGGLGGGKLGPDLTGAFKKWGDGLIVWPSADSPSDTMRPIFSDKPLTLQEKADLLAFFRTTAVSKRSTEVIWGLVGLAAAGTAVFAGLAALIWRRRLSKVRQPMVSR